MPAPHRAPAAKEHQGQGGIIGPRAIRAVMTLQGCAHRLTAQGLAQWVASFAALLAVLPALFTLPATDRDESRFAEASAQMLESGDFTNIMFQDTPRYKKPV